MILFRPMKAKQTRTASDIIPSDARILIAAAIFFTDKALLPPQAASAVWNCGRPMKCYIQTVNIFEGDALLSRLFSRGLFGAPHPRMGSENLR
jgi:hypothetical protein